MLLNMAAAERATPIYETLPGWQADISARAA
jgi:adenylosuccinate synthase